MKAKELAAILDRHPEALVMIRDATDRILLTPTTVSVERHDDADGSSTIWIDTEEY